MIPTGVNVHNSLGDSLQPLMRENGLPLRVYTCGPTVYAESHLGHARTYVSLDMIRRILTDYFKVPVTWSMNITDIDDKIINEFNNGKTGFNTVFEYAKDRENAFFKDLNRLNVKTPDAILRVTEVIPQIIKFIEDLIDNGFAYESGGSAYFNVDKYEKDPRFVYAEIERESYLATLNHENPNEIDEAAITKTNRSDFVLWKAAKPGEPYWDSPWGKGRPGWHIECSAMSNMFYGTHFDVHCGGIDLRFPHHTNEIAQSQARFGVVPWVKTWLHTGQLRINGEKMSKSFGNFKSIANALSQFTPRQIRMMFALVGWQNVLELSDGLIERAISLDSRINNFLQMADTKMRSPIADMKKGFTDDDFAFISMLEKAQETIAEAFANNFDIPSAIQSLSSIIDAVYANENIIDTLVISAGRIVHSVMEVLGFIPDSIAFTSGSSSLELVPFAKALSEHRVAYKKNGITVLNIVKALTDELGLDLKAEATSPAHQMMKDLSFHVRESLKGLDAIRDELAPVLGIRMEDSPDGKACSFKICDPQEIIAMKKTKAAQKAMKQNVKAEPPAPKKEEPILHPNEILQSQTDKYSAFDETGFPTHDSQGVELTKSQTNKIRKWYGIQLRKYNQSHGIKE